MTLAYVPQRQMLPLSPLRISSSVALGFLVRNARVATTKPGVQKPHCWASQATKAAGTASLARLSTVAIFFPAHRMASSTLAEAGLPSMRTVLAPLEASLLTGLA